MDTESILLFQGCAFINIEVSVYGLAKGIFISCCILGACNIISFEEQVLNLE